VSKSLCSYIDVCRYTFTLVSLLGARISRLSRLSIGNAIAMRVYSIRSYLMMIRLLVILLAIRQLVTVIIVLSNF